MIILHLSLSWSVSCDLSRLKITAVVKSQLANNAVELVVIVIQRYSSSNLSSSRGLMKSKQRRICWCCCVVMPLTPCYDYCRKKSRNCQPTTIRFCEKSVIGNCKRQLTLALCCVFEVLSVHVHFPSWCQFVSILPSKYSPFLIM